MKQGDYPKSKWQGLEGFERWQGVYRLQVNDGPVGRCAWSYDGRLLAAPSLDGAIRLWSMPSGTLRSIIRLGMVSIHAVAWSSSGQLAAACGDGSVQICAPDSSRPIATLRQHIGEVRGVSWDGTTLASAGADGTICLWDLQSSEPKQKWTDFNPYGTSALNTIAWSPTGKFLAAGDASGYVQVWDTQNGSLYRRINAHTSHVMSVLWSSREQVVSGSYDGSVRVWDLPTSLCVQFCKSEDRITALSLSADESVLAVRRESKTARILRYPTMREDSEIEAQYSNYWAANVTFHPHAPVLAISGNYGVEVWCFGSRFFEPLKVFLCHSSGDKTAVRMLYSKLNEGGFDPWLDAEDLVPGQEWRVEIERAVRLADVVVVCLSKSSITKEGFVQKEIRYALDSAEEKPEGTIYLIPVRLEACEVPRQLQRWQWVDYFEPDGHEKLERALRARLTPLQEP